MIRVSYLNHFPCPYIRIHARKHALFGLDHFWTLLLVIFFLKGNHSNLIKEGSQA
jgi:hypothetical protein